MTTDHIRPPVVAVMGHIDHGKTSLLDKIRSTSVTRKEAGGITQHIGAYQTSVSTKEHPNSLVTFIDTPGHAAFINMRSRGANATDIVVLVIASNDGIMAQTKESLKIIQAAELPFIVALNKIDLPESSPEKVKGQLVELGHTPEEYGGQLTIVPVSAKTGEGVDKLLDVILLNAEVMELKSEPNAPLEAIVIESRLENNRGPVATVIVRKGTLRLGDTIFANDIQGKAKALIDYSGKNIKEAGPSTPVEILGFEKTPSVGTVITDISVKLPDLAPLPLIKTAVINSDDEITPRLSVIIKADVQGTLEALLNSFTDDVQIIHSGVGPITDNDVFLAEVSKAQIFAFNVPVPKFIKNLADNNKVSIHESRIIYEIIDDIQSQVLKLLEPTIDETVTGEATIKAEFKIEKVRIAGIQSTKGELSKGNSVHLKRDGKIIKDTKIEGIRQGKSIVDKIKMGNEAGITFKPYVDFKINDVIIAYNKS